MLPNTHTHTQREAIFWLWKCDVKKFFDSVDQATLLKILSWRIQDNTTFNLLKTIISSYTTSPNSSVGMPIGNLTSQIFANIYLNELDRFVKHILKVKAYVRYGDDFIILENDLEKLKSLRTSAFDFLKNKLKLEVNPKSDKIFQARRGHLFQLKLNQRLPQELQKIFILNRFEPFTAARGQDDNFHKQS